MKENKNRSKIGEYILKSGMTYDYISNAPNNPCSRSMISKIIERPSHASYELYMALARFVKMPEKLAHKEWTKSKKKRLNDIVEKESGIKL